MTTPMSGTGQSLSSLSLARGSECPTTSAAAASGLGGIDLLGCRSLSSNGGWSG